MATRNVVVTERQAKMIQDLVGSGRYQNASEVVREGLRLIEQQEMDYSAKLEALREAIAVGVADLERGAYKEFEDAHALADYLDQIWEEVSPAPRDSE
jgi:antitoxin ParD1/3/4